MSAQTLTLALPLADEAALRAGVDALDEGRRSPLLDVPGTHVARLAVVAGALVVNVKCDGDPDDWAGRLCHAAPAVAGLIAATCAGAPRAGDARAMARWLLRHRVRPLVSVAAAPHATVEDVCSAVAVHERFARFAVRGQRMAPAELRRAFLEEFGT